MLSLLPFSLSLTIVLPAFGQTYTISTIAGDTLPLSVLGTSASLGPYAPQYIAADAAGNLFFHRSKHHPEIGRWTRRADSGGRQRKS